MNSTLLVISLSVLMHVTWNLLARHVEARCNYLWWGLLAHLVILGPWALWRLAVDSQWNNKLVLAMLITSLANMIYFLALRKAYHYAPVALVYPIARSSPILIALWAFMIFDESPSIVAMLGIGISVIGLWILASSAKNGELFHALLWAALAAFATSVYSLSDKVAIQYLTSFGAQLGFITVGYAVSFLGITIVQYREIGRFIPVCRPKLSYILIGGLFIGTAYALVVRAMLELPAAYVVTYTNAGIVLATVLSIWILKERKNWKQQIIASIAISAGLLILGIEAA